MLLQHKMDGGLLVNDASTFYNNANKHKQLQIFQERRCKIRVSVIHEKGYTLSSFKVTPFKQAAISQRNAGKTN